MKQKCLLFIIILLIIFCPKYMVTFASEEDDLSDAVEDAIDILDTSQLDGFLNDLVSRYSFSNINFKDELYKLVTGNVDYDITNIFSFILEVVFSNVKKIIPLIILLFGIGILGSLITNIVASSENINIINTIVVISTILITVVSFKDVLSITYDIVQGVSDFVAIIFPMMLSLVVSTIGGSTATTLMGLTTITTAIIHFVFHNILYPIIIFVYVLTILGALSNFVKLDKFTGFLFSCFKFVVGITFTVFIGFLGLQSLTTLRFDSMSIRATKFAISSFVPLVGSFLSQGFDYIMMGSLLVKNGVGVIGIIIIVGTVFMQVISIYILRLSYSFIGGVLEFVGDSAVSKYLDKFSKVMLLPIVLILSVTFFYIVLMSLFIIGVGVG